MDDIDRLIHQDCTLRNSMTNHHLLNGRTSLFPERSPEDTGGKYTCYTRIIWMVANVSCVAEKPQSKFAAASRGEVQSDAYAVMVAVLVNKESGLEKPHVVTMLDTNPPYVLLAKPELERYLAKTRAPMPSVPNGRYLHEIERISGEDTISPHH